MRTTFLKETFSDSKWNLNRKSEDFYGLTFTRKFTGKTWNFGFSRNLASKLLGTLYCQENSFLSKEAQNFEFHSKREFRLILRQFES
jgi:hypothetical protein